MRPVEIRPPESLPEYRQACTLVEQTYRGKLALDSSVKLVHPNALLIAVKDEQVIGSMGFQSGDQGTLPTEAAFNIALGTVCQCPRRQVVEVLRMAIADHCRSAVLRGFIAAAIQYARYRCEARFWLMTMKPTLPMALLRHCRLRVEQLPVTLADASIATRHPAYWAEPPVPRAWVVGQPACDVALEWLMKNMGTDVELQLSAFDHHMDYSRTTTYRDDARVRQNPIVSMANSIVDRLAAFGTPSPGGDGA